MISPRFLRIRCTKNDSCRGAVPMACGSGSQILKSTKPCMHVIHVWHWEDVFPDFILGGGGQKGNESPKTDDVHTRLQVNSIGKRKPGIIIAQVLQLLPGQLIPRIPPTSSSHPILPDQIPQKQRTSNPTDPCHTQTNPIPSAIPRRLVLKEDITGNQPAAISKSDLHCRRDALLVMARHIIT